MNAPLAQDDRASALFRSAYGQLCVRTDRLFAGLLVFQYLAGIMVAFWISPQTWIGARSERHIHVLAAVLLGGVITSLPVACAFMRPGLASTRHALAAGQALSGALLIHLTGGRIETHFHIFGSLAFLAFYRDWRVLVTASAVVTVDHLVRGSLWPQSVFGVLASSPWRSVEHMAWVVFEDLFLIPSCILTRREMTATAERRAQLERHQEHTEATVLERTEELNAEIEHRQAAEQYSQLVLQYAADPIIVIDKKGVILSASDSVLAVFGWDATELVGHGVSVLMPKPYPDLHDGFLGMSRRLEGQRKDGTTVPVELTSSRIGDPADPVFVGILRDLSSRIKLEQELESARRLESIGHLAAGVAHEINTPTQYVGDNTRFLEDSFRELAPILKLAGELASSIGDEAGSEAIASELVDALEKADVDYLSEEIPRAIEQSLGGIDRVRTIVRSMKEFSHPGQEGMSCIDLARAIETTITVATSEWKYVADVVRDFDLDLPEVSCLPGEINQVILNLIVNAAHAIADVVEIDGDSSGRRGTIVIRTRRDDRHVILSISDTGSGIPEPARDRIFDPFFTTKAVGKGTGQGLSHAYGVVVNKHGGTIEFETEIGKGTTFIVRLPLERSGTTEALA